MNMFVEVCASTAVDLDVLRSWGYIDQATANQHNEPEALIEVGTDESGLPIYAVSPEYLEFSKQNHPTDIDELHEAAGRGCYGKRSFLRPRPETAGNQGYLGNIIGEAHLSVLGHGGVSFAVKGVSRAMLLELERHSKRSHHNFSVLSQRYVNHGVGSDASVAYPPLFDESLRKELDDWFLNAQARYDAAYNRLRDQGHGLKAARGAARAFLPEATSTSFLVTASVRGWREMLEQRLPENADAEIRFFAYRILDGLARVCPNSVQDLTAAYLGEEIKSAA